MDHASVVIFPGHQPRRSLGAWHPQTQTRPLGDSRGRVRSDWSVRLLHVRQHAASR